jgi:hypothetical protein
LIHFKEISSLVNFLDRLKVKLILYDCITYESGSFLVASQRGSKELSCLLGSERLEKYGKLKFRWELASFISGPRNFIQHKWSIG